MLAASYLQAMHEHLLYELQAPLASMSMHLLLLQEEAINEELALQLMGASPLEIMERALDMFKSDIAIALSLDIGEGMFKSDIAFALCFVHLYLLLAYTGLEDLSYM
ncbi:hypothetical protein GOP47_0012227 [Adiantum capillus-veneris]|uniref:Uncharacterized protein n=1 Tax=Adiantum capillus-veneris TaxID=13818 RepID=A0A9D4UR08_ADICA|nr:hypothetical protein GOP47_0012227 [Adiantum capillus-veneris]